MSSRNRLGGARTRRRLWRLFWALVVLTGAAGVALWLGPDGTTAPASAASVRASSPMDSGGGRELYLRDCAWCHGDKGQGTSLAPDLLDSGESDVDFMLRTGRMPLGHAGEKPEPGPPQYSSAKIRGLVAYVGSLGHGPAIPAVKKGDIANGEELFLLNCAACHSASGTGVILTDGDRTPQLYDTPPTQVAEAIRMGPGQMPPFSDKQMTDEDMDDVVSYVQQLGPEQVRGGVGLDQYGPIFEGVFLFLLPMPVLVGVLLLLGRRNR